MRRRFSTIPGKPVCVVKVTPPPHTHTRAKVNDDAAGFLNEGRHVKVQDEVLVGHPAKVLAVRHSRVVPHESGGGRI